MILRFLGPIQAPGREMVERVEREFAGGTARDLLKALGYGEEQVWFLSIVVNEERLGPDDRVEAGDEVTLMLIVGGG